MTLTAVLLDLSPPTSPQRVWRADVVHQSGAVATTAVQARQRAPIPGVDPPEPGSLAADGNETRLGLAPTKSLLAPAAPSETPVFNTARQGAFRQSGSVLLLTPEDRDAADHNPGVLRGGSCEHLTESDKRLVVHERSRQALQSAQRFTPLGVSMLSADSQTQGARVWAAGSVRIDRERGQGSWLWQSGAFMPAVEQLPQSEGGGEGRWRLRLAPSKGLSRGQATILCTPRGQAEPGLMVLPTVLQLSPTDKSVCLRTEDAGGALGGIDGFDVVVLASQGRGDDPALSGTALVRQSLGAIRFVPQLGPAPSLPVLAYRSGGLLETVERPRRGELIVELGPRAALSPERAALIACPYGIVAPGRLRSVAVEHVSLTRKRLTLLEEDRPTLTDAATSAGPSVRADYDVDFAFFERR